MNEPKIRVAIREGKLRLGAEGDELNCAVLDDETRVFTQKTFLTAIGHTRPGGGQAQKGKIENLPFFLANPNLRPFISDDLRRSSSPILFRPLKGSGGRQTVGGGKGGRGYAVGLDAAMFPQVCRVYVDARDAGVLTKVQQRIAEKCERILRGLIGVAIVALVDEATGYQEIRERDALQRILEAYINPEMLPWTSRFPIEYFKQVFRLRGWQFNPQLKGPRYLGKLNNQLIYEKLPPGVLEQLREKNPVNQKGGRRSYKHHQFLTEDIGNPHLERQLVGVTTLMRAAPNWVVFERMFKRAFPTRKGQIEFPFAEFDIGEAD